MGILNVTPDSFYDGSRYTSLNKAIKHVELMISEGAAIIDVGGESSRPGSVEVSVQEELDRTIPAIEKICTEFSIPVSIDTQKPSVMQAAINAGAVMVNDIVALTNPGAMDVIKKSNVAVCLMHKKGNPANMQFNSHYQDVVLEVYNFLAERVATCTAAGINKERIIIDPGFGFGKTVQENLLLLKYLEKFTAIDCCILIGLSRKSSIGKILDNAPPEQRLYASIAAATLAVSKGAKIIRTHDVLATYQAVKFSQAMLEADVKSTKPIHI